MKKVLCMTFLFCLLAGPGFATSPYTPPFQNDATGYYEVAPDDVDVSDELLDELDDIASECFDAFGRGDVVEGLVGVAALDVFSIGGAIPAAGVDAILCIFPLTESERNFDW